jgi:hypothetical protein
MNPLIQLKRTTPAFFIALLIVCPGLSPKAQAVIPAPDGGYPGQNTAEGDNALLNLTSGNDNTVNGEHALYRNTTGSGNTVDGNFALNSNTTGNLNTAVGYTALNSNSGNFNIALGAGAGNNLTTGDNNIDIGNVGRPRESNRIRIGTVGTQKRTFIAGISGVTVAGGVGVIVDSNGQLGTMTSSERFKDEIKSMDKASEAILALKPVTFHYKRELDPARIPQFGLVAEQVANVNPDLVARDAEGKIYSVRYEAVNAMLLNEFLKEHRRVQRLEAALAAMDRQLKTQDAKIKRVNDKVELIKPAPLTVLNDQ